MKPLSAIDAGARAARCLAALALAAAAASAAAADTEPRGVVTLAASASVEAATDWIAITLATLREGGDAAAVQAGLKQAVDAALAEARRAAKPGQIEVRTGAFSISPRYTPKGERSNWRGHAELVLEGRDIGGIAALAGRIGTLAVARVAHSLSRERRAEAEAEATARAVAAYRAKAAEVARRFGYARHTLREVNVSSSEPPMHAPRAMAAVMVADEALPVQTGVTTVSVTVQGSVQLLDPAEGERP